MCITKYAFGTFLTLDPNVLYFSVSAGIQGSVLFAVLLSALAHFLRSL